MATFAQTAAGLLTPRKQRATAEEVQATVDRLFYGAGTSVQQEQTHRSNWSQAVAARRARPLPITRGGTFGHMSTVQRLPAVGATTTYLSGRASSNSPNPLRIVNHSLHGTGQLKMNPDRTAPGRIRNASGGFYCK
jgi:hypothetical protein